jgi:hypothetical protein
MQTNFSPLGYQYAPLVLLGVTHGDSLIVWYRFHDFGWDVNLEKEKFSGFGSHIGFFW